MNFSVALQTALLIVMILVGIGVGVGLLMMGADLLARYYHRRDVAEGLSDVQFLVRYQEPGQGHQFRREYRDDLPSATALYTDLLARQLADPGSITNLIIERRKVGRWEQVRIDERVVL